MKKGILLLSLLLIAGCTYGQDYLDNPSSFIRDPHFGEYKKKRDSLESSYLAKKITYAEFVEKKKELDERYSKEVRERDNKISAQE